MAYTQLTPPLRARGKFTVRLPFRIADDVDYTCVAIRSFSDIYREGEKPYTKIYLPAGLADGTPLDDGSTFDFKTEETLGINIVTLMDDRNNAYLIPDNYIVSYPTQTGVVYREFFLSCSLGMLPDYSDLTAAKAAIQTAVMEQTGVEVTVNEHTLSTLTSPTYEQHLAYEQAREAAILLAPSKDDELTAKDARINELNQTVERLILILRDNNLLDQINSGE